MNQAADSFESERGTKDERASMLVPECLVDDESDAMQLRSALWMLRQEQASAKDQQEAENRQRQAAEDRERMVRQKIIPGENNYLIVLILIFLIRSGKGLSLQTPRSEGHGT
eukprot:SAG31_NODE_1712_length_7468_cov_8.329896_7_plen_112_part_00